MRKTTYKYRATEPYQVIEREFDVFEEPESLEVDGVTFFKVPNQATKGWVQVEYVAEGGGDSIIEYWEVGRSPEAITHNGKTYLKQFGVPTIADPFRIGSSSLLDKCDKGFQEVMKEAKRKSGASRL